MNLLDDLGDFRIWSAIFSCTERERGRESVWVMLTTVSFCYPDWNWPEEWCRLNSRLFYLLLMPVPHIYVVNLAISIMVAYLCMLFLFAMLPIGWQWLCCLHCAWGSYILPECCRAPPELFIHVVDCLCYDSSLTKWSHSTGRRTRSTMKFPPRETTTLRSTSFTLHGSWLGHCLSPTLLSSELAGLPCGYPSQVLFFAVHSMYFMPCS